MNLRPIRVPAYMVPAAQKIRHVEQIMHKDTGLVIDSPTVTSERQPDGRVQLKVKGRKSAIPAVPPPGGTTMYLQFKVKFDGDTAGYRELFWFADNTDWITANFIFIGYFYTNRNIVLQDNSAGAGGGSINGPDDSCPDNTWVTVDVKLDFAAAPAITMRLSGVDVGTVTAFANPDFSIAAIMWGLMGNNAGNFNLDDLRLGTSDWGSSELFAANNTVGFLVPPFDLQYFDYDPRISVVAGTIRVNNDYGVDFLQKNVAFPA